MKKWATIILPVIILCITGVCTVNKLKHGKNYVIGQRIDSLNGVYVYYNGNTGNTSGRNITIDNYNLGLKYQCVEFVKRYYYEYLHHKMPDSYGHAKDFFDTSLADGQKNPRRNLIQYKNGSHWKPQPDDLVIYGPIVSNKYGHVSIISKVTDDEVEVIQQNPGTFSSTRQTFGLEQKDGKWFIDKKRILGWLRKE